jgi:hypothetical protein
MGEELERHMKEWNRKENKEGTFEIKGSYQIQPHFFTL